MTSVIERLTLSPDVRIISNTEVDIFLTCQNRHRYHFLLDKIPKQYSKALTRGIVGHEMLAAYYKALQAGQDKLEASQEGMRVLTQAFNDLELNVLGQLRALFNRYVGQDILPETSEILEVEKDYYIPLANQNFAYGLRLDLLVKSRSGRSKGETRIIDHKFTYDFFTVDDLNLAAQLPKYVGALRYNGIPVDGGLLNQIRTRFESSNIPKKSDTDLFRKDAIPLTKERIYNTLKQQIQTSERIMERYSLSPELQKEEAIPILNKMICKMCPYKDPCFTELNGRDIKLMMQYNFKESDYGYNKNIEA